MKRLGIVLCLLSFGFIFYNSSRPGSLSNLRSYGIVQSIRNDNHNSGRNNLTKVKPGVLHISSREKKIKLIIRKSAHVFEYCILAVVVTNLLFLLGMMGRNALPSIMLICLLYAVTDEFHQTFVPGRTSLVSDVLIDFTGSLIGMGLFYLAYYKIYAKRLIKKVRS